MRGMQYDRRAEASLDLHESQGIYTRDQFATHFHRMARSVNRHSLFHSFTIVSFTSDQFSAHIQRRTVSQKELESGTGKGDRKTEKQIITPANIAFEHTPEWFPAVTPMSDVPNNVGDAPNRIRYMAFAFVDDADIMFDEIENEASTDTFEPENQWTQPSESVDISNEQYDIHLHQGVQPRVPVISSNFSQRDAGTFIERWGGSYTMMEDLVWAMQMEHTRFPEYQPHLHYSEESSLCGALGDFIYSPLSYM